MGPVSKRLDSLTGIRAFAVVLVFWHHSNEHYGGISSGMVGVSLFYILSGFVMAWVDRDSNTPWMFYRRRFARIYPAYVVACAIALVLLLMRDKFTLTDLAAFTLLQAWIPIPDVYFAANAVFWSLSCEAFFYLVFPAIRAAFRALSVRGVVLVGVGALLTSLTIAGIGALFPPSDLTQWAVVVFPPSRLPEFVLGVALGYLFARGWRPSVSLWIAVPLSGAAVIAAAYAPYALSRFALTLVPFALLVAALASVDLGGRPSFARWTPIVKLGIWSFCFYLVHNMVLDAFMAMGARLSAPLWLTIPAALVAGVASAWLLHSLVERPAERRLRPAKEPRLDTDARAAV